MTRTCGDCQLCCTLLPVLAIKKGANERCKHQGAGKCAIYRAAGFPYECGLWSCRWLLQSQGTQDLQRPDVAGYVVDPSPDFVTVSTYDGKSMNIQAVQIWVDPDRREAHRDARLREYLARLGGRRIAAIIRYSATEAFVLFPPAFTGGRWIEQLSSVRPVTHSAADIAAMLGDEIVFNALDEVTR